MMQRQFQLRFFSAFAVVFGVSGDTSLHDLAGPSQPCPAERPQNHLALVQRHADKVNETAKVINQDPCVLCVNLNFKGKLCSMSTSTSMSAGKCIVSGTKSWAYCVDYQANGTRVSPVTSCPTCTTFTTVDTCPNGRCAWDGNSCKPVTSSPTLSPTASPTQAPTAPWPVTYANNECCGSSGCSVSDFEGYESFGACMQQCEEDTSCIGIEYGNNAEKKGDNKCTAADKCRCYLVRACSKQSQHLGYSVYLKPPPTPAPTPSPTAATASPTTSPTTVSPCPPKPGTQCQGNDVLVPVWPPPYTSTAEECADLCSKNDKCQAYTFNNGPDGHQGLVEDGKFQCWLKDKCEPLTNDPLATSGVCTAESASTTCTDTPDWVNGDSGKNCAHYALDFCAHGGPRAQQGWTLGSTYNNPEENCCVCGKGTTAQFEKIETGACSDHGRSPIHDKATCDMAADALGLHDTKASAGTWSNRPEGCYYKPGESTNSRLQFNGGGEGQGSDSARYQICGPTAATAVGDPHLVNTRGEHFSIFRSGQVEFIRVPYESVTEEADMTVHATIQSFGETDKCKEALYITGLRFGGSWFKGKPLEINVDFIRPGTTEKEMKVLLGSVPVVPSTDPIDVGDKMALHMQDNKQIVLMVDGASVVVDQRRTAGRGFLNVKADSFSKLSQKIGGLLGEDDHSAFSTKPARCEHELVTKAAQPVYSSASMSA